MSPRSTHSVLVFAGDGRLKPRPARKHAAAEAPPDEKTKLVAEECAGRRNGHDPLQAQVTTMRRDAGEREQRFAFEHTAYEHDRVAVLLDEAGKIHV